MLGFFAKEAVAKKPFTNNVENSSVLIQIFCYHVFNELRNIMYPFIQYQSCSMRLMEGNNPLSLYGIHDDNLRHADKLFETAEKMGDAGLTITECFTPKELILRFPTEQSMLQYLAIREESRLEIKNV